MSLSPPVLSPPDAADVVAYSTTMTFRLLSRQSCVLLGNRGLSDVFKIFGVRATMQPAKDDQGLVEVTLSGSHYYAALAHQWIIARVAPQCVTSFHLSTADVSVRIIPAPPAPLFAFSPLQFQLQVLFGAKQKNLTEFQTRSCCYIAESPPRSGNLLLQGSPQDVATAAQLINRAASTKRLSISLDLGELFHQGNIAPLRQPTPFHVHGMLLRPTAVAAIPAPLNCPASPEDSRLLPDLPAGTAINCDPKSLISPTRFSLRPDLSQYEKSHISPL